MGTPSIVFCLCGAKFFYIEGIAEKCPQCNAEFKKINTDTDKGGEVCQERNCLTPKKSGESQ